MLGVKTKQGTQKYDNRRHSLLNAFLSSYMLLQGYREIFKYFLSLYFFLFFLILSIVTCSPACAKSIHILSEGQYLLLLSSNSGYK